MSITFRKISRYPIPITSAQVGALLMGRSDPPAFPDQLKVTDKPTLCSTAYRARMSIIGPLVIHTYKLAEIKFDPARILGLKSITISSEQVRESFVIGWINDQLAQPRKEIIQEVVDVLKQARHYPNCLVVSHTFRLTITRAYLIEGERLLQNPELIRKYIRPKNKLMAFGQEFVARS